MSVFRSIRIGLAVSLGFSALTGCATIKYDGLTVLGPPPRDAAETAYRNNLAALVANQKLERLGHSTPVLAADAAPADAELAKTRSELEKAAARLGDEPEIAAKAPKNARGFANEWRTARQIFVLGPDQPGDSANIYRFSGVQARKLQVTLVRPGDVAVRLSLDCDGPVSTRRKSGSRLSLIIGHGERGPELTFGDETNACTADAFFPENGKTRRYRLLRDETHAPAVAALESAFEVCATPPAGRLTALEKAFWSARWLSQTCAFDPGKVTLLREERAAFDAKVAVLLGAPLPERFYRDQDPCAPLDFSQAPRLSLIYLSYLDIKADFSGHVINRLLRHHAARGAIIRIIATDVLEREKDRAMLERLAVDYPNVEIRAFKWKAPSGIGFRDRVAAAHRVHHIKMIAGISPDSGRSRAVVGSRNIHDGFLFKDPVDLSAYPELNQYSRNGGLTLDYYSNWTDFDLSIAGDKAVRTLAAHLSSFWHGDADTFAVRPFSIGGKTAAALSGRGLMRHFISAPFADGRALEDYYAELFDAARHTIEIVNPYLNLTPKLRTAFEAALNRGVKVTIVGRINLYGDLGGTLLTEMNMQFLNTYGDRITFREYREPDVLLHAKILMIDREFVVVSSVNLNNRSFLHDTENGIAVLDPAFYARMKPHFDAYFSASDPVAGRKLKAFWRALLSVRVLREAL
ncbi:MAG: phosphatidylserine/phosphatidylglycerophosphate/cardiolipin synthase family protein [Phyllobacteriaceae bacterium]|nr:phosphatidylserine/phosphatidylglycerophosphate/cardiolipin synthase family protein [Phyllobacteriaceae bacterium]